jgi:hypothetical protein
MKKIISSSLVLFALLATPLARAAWPVTYNDGDLLLIFRENGFNDVEFDLGTVSNYLGHADGFTTSVTGWSLSEVTSAFGSSDLTGVSVILLASTKLTNSSPTAWFSAPTPQPYWENGVAPYHAAYNVSPSVWQTYWSTINSIGTRPGIYLPTTNQFSPSSPVAYDQIVSLNGQAVTGNADALNTYSWIPLLGGNAPFTVEQVIPGSFGLVAVQPSTAISKPLDTYVGTFAIDASGNLTFVAGAKAPTLSGITRSGNVSTVTFDTTVSGNYSLLYSNKLGGASANWTVIGGSVVGDGNSNPLTHTNSSNTGFYRVQRTP